MLEPRVLYLHDMKISLIGESSAGGASYKRSYDYM